MNGRHRVPQRKVIFIGTEGDSDRAFAQFLQRCCDQEHLRVHLKIKPASGGDSVKIVEDIGRWLAKNDSGKNYQARLVLLDRDRIEQDLRAGRDAQAAATRLKLELVFQDPNLEGLLLRLHPGPKRQNIAAHRAISELQKVWPTYKKPPTADLLQQRFTLDDVQRAAVHDQHLRKLLEVLGL